MSGPLYFDRVKESTSTTGTGTYTLGGAVTGFQAFSVVGDGNTCYYAITDGTNWEVGLGTYTLSGTTLARTSILASSNSGSAVSWSAGAKSIWLDLPAAFFGQVNAGTAGPNNFSLAASVSGNALTIAIKGNDGNDPSVGNPVVISFRSSTAATGTYSYLVLTAATSLVISSGSTMGFSNAIPGRLWIVGFNDAGTFRLGAVNALSGTSVMPLRDNLILSSTAEGGSGGADSAQVIYTGTAVTSKGARLLGYMEWSAGLTTAGTWATGPTLIQVFEPGISKPGDIVQVQFNSTGTLQTGTTILPGDNTTPQQTEGDQYMSQAITPTATPNVLQVEHVGIYFNTNSSSGQLAAALFQDSGANALATIFQANTNNLGAPMTLFYQLLAGTVSSTTFKIRAGNGAAGTTSFSGRNGGSFYNGTIASYLKVTELMA